MSNVREVPWHIGSMNNQDNSDEFFLDPKVIYDQREKLAEKEAREDSLSSNPGAHSSMGSGNSRSHTNTSKHYSPKKPPSHGASDKNAKESPRESRVSTLSDEDDDFVSYVNPQEILDQREKLAAKDGQQPGTLLIPPIGAAPSSSASHKTSREDTTATTESLSKGKQRSKHEKRSWKHTDTESSDRQEEARGEMPIQASLIMPINNDDPVIIAMTTREESENGSRNLSKRWLICVIVSVVAVGVGIGVAVGTFSKPFSSDTQVPLATELPTMSPSVVTASPSPAPILVIRPSDQDCQRIAAGQPVLDQDQLTPRRFVIVTEVTAWDSRIFTENSSFDPRQWIETTILPALANCEMERRALGSLQMVHLSEPDRKLQSTKALVADAQLVDFFLEDSCLSEGTTTCQVVMEIDLFFDADVPKFQLEILIRDTFGNAEFPEQIKDIEVERVLEEQN